MDPISAFTLTFWIFFPIILIYAISNRVSVERKIKQEAERVSRMLHEEKPDLVRSGLDWEAERTRLIEQIIIPKLGNTGKLLARKRHKWRQIEEILDTPPFPSGAVAASDKKGGWRYSGQ